MTTTLILANPWIMLGWLALPALWLLFRMTPPSARTIRFPAVRLLKDLKPEERTRSVVPPWLIVLRLAAVALFVLGLAAPVLNPPPLPGATGPVLLVVDNGWAAAPHWRRIETLMSDLIAEADRTDRAIIMTTTTGDELPDRQMSAAEAADRLADLRPNPWTPDREAVFDRLESTETSALANAFWLSDGLDYGNGARLEQRLLRFSTVDLVTPRRRELPVALSAPDFDGETVTITLRRTRGRGREDVFVLAEAAAGRVMARHPVSFANEERLAETRFELPIRVRNQIARLRLEGQNHAGAVWHADGRSHLSLVGIAAEPEGAPAQPLLSERYYIERSLTPFARFQHGDLAALTGGDVDAIIMGDRGGFSSGDIERLTGWIENGGVLIRFSGEKLAASGEQALLPTRLRIGGRAMGGAMSWDQPAALASFADDSPLAGLAVPEDLQIDRQILAEPGAPGAEVWARLEDGTPLLTARHEGDGWLVLFHVSANTDWSELPITGLFVEMLERLVRLHEPQLRESDIGDRLDPVILMDGHGRLTRDPVDAAPITRQDWPDVKASAATPPGLYGEESAPLALNLAGDIEDFSPLVAQNNAIDRSYYSSAKRIALRPWVLLIALVLWLGDYAATLALQGRLPRPDALRKRAAAALGVAVPPLIALAAVALFAGESRAQGDGFALEAASELHFGYIETEDRSLNAETRAGLVRLGEVLAIRTSVETGAPMAIDPERHDMIYFPLIYWPVSATDGFPSESALDRIGQYLATGEILVFDTGGRPQAQQWLRMVLNQLNMPPLTPVPEDHVIRRSFYLIDDFPGRTDGGAVWVALAPDDGVENVSAVLIGANDWASAWANAAARPLNPSLGAISQREAALRFGVNLVMYALTGNYKADQLHIDAILERIGR